MEAKHAIVPILPATDLDVSQAFYEQLGFEVTSAYESYGYRILIDRHGASLHLTRVDPEWMDKDRNAHAIYLYAKDVDGLAQRVGCKAEQKPWGMREFAITDPDGTLVRVGWSE